jgi:hypothetical protein
MGRTMIKRKREQKEKGDRPETFSTRTREDRGNKSSSGLVLLRLFQGFVYIQLGFDILFEVWGM